MKDKKKYNVIYNEHMKARSEIDMDNWPPTARKAYAAAVAEHNKRSNIYYFMSYNKYY